MNVEAEKQMKNLMIDFFLFCIHWQYKFLLLKYCCFIMRKGVCVCVCELEVDKEWMEFFRKTKYTTLMNSSFFLWFFVYFIDVRDIVQLSRIHKV